MRSQNRISSTPDFAVKNIPYFFSIEKKSGVRSYRYSFQGQEKDDEIKGEGNSVNYKYRMHDPRVGRFFAIDPLTREYPELTPYQFSSNSPIALIEREGLEGVRPFGNSILTTFANGGFSLTSTFGFQDMLGRNTTNFNSTTNFGNNLNINPPAMSLALPQADVVNYLVGTRWARRQAEINRMPNDTPLRARSQAFQQNKLNTEIANYNNTVDYINSALKLHFENLQPGDQVVVSYQYQSAGVAVTKTKVFDIETNDESTLDFSLPLQKGDNKQGDITNVNYNVVRGTASDGTVNNSQITGSQTIENSYSEHGGDNKPVRRGRAKRRSKSKS